VLENLPTRARTTGNEAAARSRLVRRLRFILPVIALVLIGAFLLNTQSNDVDDAFLDDFKNFGATPEELSMARPKFAGVDNAGKPFEITADAARQNTNVKDVVALEKPHAVQGESSGESTVVSADRGVYHSDNNILELEEDVTLRHTVGADTYVFKSPAATVAIKDEIVTSDEGVGGSGPNGRSLEADHMKAYNGEGRVVFEGNVRMRIYPKGVTAPDDTQQDQSSAQPPALKDPENETPQ